MKMVVVVVGQITNRVGPLGRRENQTAGKPDRETECLEMQDVPQNVKPTSAELVTYFLTSVPIPALAPVEMSIIVLYFRVLLRYCWMVWIFCLEDSMRQLKRITVDPQVMGGKPCIRDLRVTVGTIVGLIGAGRTTEDVLEAYPYLEREDILEALSYAAWRAEEIEVSLAS